MIDKNSVDIRIFHLGNETLFVEPIYDGIMCVHKAENNKIFTGRKDIKDSNIKFFINAKGDNYTFFPREYEKIFKWESIVKFY